jgi:Lon protease-like protein
MEMVVSNLRRWSMSTGAIELPLFPLNVVLFPGMVLPLHIFEPRYRQMITECRKENKPFGVVLIRPHVGAGVERRGGSGTDEEWGYLPPRQDCMPPPVAGELASAQREDTYAVGTTAEIRELDELEDGRFILLAIGVQRFRILSRHRANKKRPYLSGLVEPYEDLPESPQKLASSAKQAQALFERYLAVLLEAAGKETMEVNLPTLPEELSYFIAYLLGAEDEQKQQLLELTSTLRRLQEEITFLHREVPFMLQMLIGDSHFADHPERSMLN